MQRIAMLNMASEIPQGREYKTKNKLNSMV
jgi:hypothetical protein